MTTDITLLNVSDSVSSSHAVDNSTLSGNSVLTKGSGIVLLTVLVLHSPRQVVFWGTTVSRSILKICVLYSDLAENTLLARVSILTANQAPVPELI